MRVFHHVVEEGGFAAAARKMDLSPAVVTRLVNDLEQHLGVRLLQRTTRRLALTQAGEAYLERLEAILRDIEDSEAMVQEHTNEMSGVVRVLAPPVAATHTLAPAIVSFQLKHPSVCVDVHVADSPDLTVHDYDLAVLTGTTHIEADVISREIISSEAVYCASPAYLDRHGVPAGPEDLLNHRVLRLRSPGVRSAPIRMYNPAEGDRLIELKCSAVIAANHTDTLLRATLEGGGISSQPVDVILPLLKGKELRRVLAPWITGRISLVAVLPSRKYLPPRTRAFLDHLVEHSRGIMRATGSSSSSARPAD